MKVSLGQMNDASKTAIAKTKLGSKVGAPRASFSPTKITELISKIVAGADETILPSEIERASKSEGPYSPILTFADLKCGMKYEPGQHVQTGNLHAGQRKLFITEVDFLTSCFEKGLFSGDVQPIVLYVGAAPNNKMLFLSKKFPNVKFVLVDPAPTNIYIMHGKTRLSHRGYPNEDIVHLRTNKNFPYKGNSVDIPERDWPTFIRESSAKIFVIEAPMTNDLAKLFSETPTVFISDVRTNGEASPTNFDIVWNNAMTFNWLGILRPWKAMLKFRMVYLDAESVKHSGMENCEKEEAKAVFDLAKKNGIDFVGDYHRQEFRFCGARENPNAHRHIQAWAGYKSTEERLWITRDDIDNIVMYDIKQTENYYYYYNCVSRSFVPHVNNNADLEIGFDYCNCCSIENYVWEKYIQVMSPYLPTKSVREYVKELSSYTQPLLKGVHGRFTGCTSEYLQSIIVDYNKLNSNKNYKMQNNGYMNIVMNDYERTINYLENLRAPPTRSFNRQDLPPRKSTGFRGKV